MPARRFLAIANRAVFVALFAATSPVWSFQAPSENSPVERAIWSGVYTPAQAARGKEIFEVQCFGCHRHDLTGSNRAPALRGEHFMLDWDHQTIEALFTKVKNDMPPVYSETVSPQSKLDIIAYILQVNGYPAGSRELAVDSNELKEVRVARKDSVEIPNFTMVEMTGCLQRRPAGVWMLTEATEPTAVSEETSGADLVANAKDKHLGTQSFRLLSAKEFGPEQHIGKVDVIGRIYRDSKDNRLNLVSLQGVAAACTN